MMHWLQRIRRFVNSLIKRIMGNYPLPAYHFTVEWGGTRTGFTEVIGLSMENEVIEYREGSSPTFSTIKMPGLRKYSNIILKRGIIKNDNDFYTWMNTINGNQVEKRDIVISLLNENHEPIRAWKLKNAWPCKIQSSDLKANANEVAIETMELAHEGLSIQNV
jgi:phage tail-like protein